MLIQWVRESRRVAKSVLLTVVIVLLAAPCFAVLAIPAALGMTYMLYGSGLVDTGVYTGTWSSFRNFVIVMLPGGLLIMVSALVGNIAAKHALDLMKWAWSHSQTEDPDNSAGSGV